MAIEIRELIIKASVDNHAQGSLEQAVLAPENRDHLIKVCVEQSVEQVLRELSRKMER
jgi:hypothetical protein